MKAMQFIWAFFLMALLPAAVMAQSSANYGQTNAPARSNHPQQISGGKIITRGGKTYNGAVVQKVTPDGLVIGYAMTDGGMGITKLKFKDLSDTLQQQFGYNPTNAAAFDKQQKHAEGEWQAQWSADDEKARSKRNEQDINPTRKPTSLPREERWARDFLSRTMDIC